MRKIRIIEQISLDGVIQAPGGRNEDGDYAHGGWAMLFLDTTILDAIIAAQGRSFDLLLGRRTYDMGGLLAEGREWSDSGRFERRDEIRRDPQAGQPRMGSGQGPRQRHRGGYSWHQIKGRP